jgi:CMP/dCMP kinase
MSSNAVLVGMMGTGKTTVGRLVAERVGMEFIDVDELIVERAGKPIPAIFDEGGEDAFRRCETEALRQLLSASNAVIATGGGIVIRGENRRLLREIGAVFWLDAPPDALLDRIGNDPNRPMLRGGDPLKRLEALAGERREFYADVSDYHLDTTEFTPEEIAERIEQALGARRQEDEQHYSTIVAIDGPVGSGKSAVARLLADRLNYVHIDTGAMYRCVTLAAMQKGTSLEDSEALSQIAHSVEIRFVERDGGPRKKGGSRSKTDALTGGGKRVLLDGEDVSETIRTPEVSRNTSPVADCPGVRAEMVRLQREMALRGRSVLEGRDISTVVAPEARWKFYLVASLEERVRRREKQYLDSGKEIDVGQLRRDIIARDERDRCRAQGALKLAPDAIILDTTDMPLAEVIETMAALIESENQALDNA